MERHPNEYWLKYLIAVSGASYKKVSEACDLYSFPTPTRTYYNKLKEQLEKTKPKPFRLDSRRTKGWLRRQRFSSLTHNESDAVAARSLLGDWKIRPIVQTLLISGMETENVPEYVEKLVGRKLRKKVVDHFKHYFWNVALMSPAQWYDYLDGLDPREKGTLLSSRTHGPEYALWRLGYRVAVDKSDVVNMILHEATMRFMETGHMHNDRHTALTAKLWTEQIFRAMEEQEKAGDIQHALKELKEIAIELKREEIKSFDDLKKEQ